MAHTPSLLAHAQLAGLFGLSPPYVLIPLLLLISMRKPVPFTRAF
jgi:hypothetical protein